MNAFDVRRILYNPESNDSNGPSYFRILQAKWTAILGSPLFSGSRYFRMVIEYISFLDLLSLLFRNLEQAKHYSHYSPRCVEATLTKFRISGIPAITWSWSLIYYWIFQHKRISSSYRFSISKFVFAKKLIHRCICKLSCRLMSTTPEFTTVGTFVHDSLSLVTCVAGSCFRAREEISRTRGL